MPSYADLLDPILTWGSQCSCFNLSPDINISADLVMSTEVMFSHLSILNTPPPSFLGRPSSKPRSISCWCGELQWAERRQLQDNQSSQDNWHVQYCSSFLLSTIIVSHASVISSMDRTSLSHCRIAVAWKVLIHKQYINSRIHLF